MVSCSCLGGASPILMGTCQDLERDGADLLYRRNGTFTSAPATVILHFVLQVFVVLIRSLTSFDRYFQKCLTYTPISARSKEWRRYLLKTTAGARCTIWNNSRRTRSRLQLRRKHTHRRGLVCPLFTYTCTIPGIWKICKLVLTPL
jgi:hypothetical protein